ncbi:hypothetical protein VTN00DRAFT_975 [Thermoascus crustaceus]|uniref:uncharacterized protein n=1 Tax=Thermoascus crustaceus TaxID=5088 RepID=UPI003742C9D8
MPNSSFTKGKSLVKAAPTANVDFTPVIAHTYSEQNSAKSSDSDIGKVSPVAAMAGRHPIHVHPAPPFYRFTATALGASMWFFLMYRAKKDGPALLGWKHPWDH